MYRDPQLSADPVLIHLPASPHAASRPAATKPVAVVTQQVCMIMIVLMSPKLPSVSPLHSESQLNHAPSACYLTAWCWEEASEAHREGCPRSRGALGRGVDSGRGQAGRGQGREQAGQAEKV